MRPLCTIPMSKRALAKLKESGYLFLEDVLTENQIKDEVLELLKPYESTSPDLLSLMPLPEVKSAQELLEEENLPQIITYSQALDGLFRGGVPVDSVTEFCGEPGSGKTQICLQLCVSVQTPNILDGLQGEAVFIDTDSGFSINRFNEIASGCKQHCLRVVEKFEQNVGLVKSHPMDKINYINIQEHSELLGTIYSLPELIENNQKIKLVVIDSLTFPFLEVTDTTLRTRLLCRILHFLKELASEHKLAIVLTNQLTTKIMKGESRLVPSLGDTAGHLITNNVLVVRSRDKCIFSATLTKSSYLPKDTIKFKVLPVGIRDVTR